MTFPAATSEKAHKKSTVKIIIHSHLEIIHVYQQ